MKNLFQRTYTNQTRALSRTTMLSKQESATWSTVFGVIQETALGDGWITIWINGNGYTHRFNTSSLTPPNTIVTFYLTAFENEQSILFAYNPEDLTQGYPSIYPGQYLYR